MQSKEWMEAKVIFLQKASKRTPDEQKRRGPSIKTNIHINRKNSLQNPVLRIIKSLENKEVTVGCFRDIEGTFHNSCCDCICSP